ncbi:MAG: hypothetical protein H6680_11100 [Desulfobacteraceae bacterium]|nr:hypothetical protein [Desulfobacteraceae bacterium]
MNDFYNFLDEQINNELRVNVGFNSLISSSPYLFDDEQSKNFFTRYEIIKEFQKICLSLFQKSLLKEEDPEIAELVLNELPVNLGENYHRDLPVRNDQTPVFFRTDEVIPGKISEIQSPGSSWGIYDQIFSFFNFHKEFNKHKRLFENSLPSQLSKALKDHLKKEPVVHHLIDNASIPWGMRYFILQTRKHGIKYFGYDKSITSYDCNFIRSHAFLGLMSDNFRRFRLEKYENKELLYDLFPSVLFDQKMPLIFPFHEKTKKYFSDEIRGIFPFCSLVTPQGLNLEDGLVSIEDFCNLPQGKRKYFLKYAGSDLEINWGSKSVFYLGNESKIRCKNILENVLKGYQNRKYWKIQKAYFTKDENAHYINRKNEIIEEKAYSKFSGFYGPNGLMGILVMQRTFPKVHGSPETVMTIA